MTNKNPDKRLDQIRNKRQNRAEPGIADWGQANPKLLQDAIAVAGASGGALRFGYTRDGGAFAIGIYLGNDHYTEYVRPDEDIDYYLKGLIADLGGDI